MCSSQATPHDTQDREPSESPKHEAAQNDAGATPASRREAKAEELALRRRFRQHAAIAFIVGLAALTLVVIVRVHPS